MTTNAHSNHEREDHDPRLSDGPSRYLNEQQQYSSIPINNSYNEGAANGGVGLGSVPLSGTGSSMGIEVRTELAPGIDSTPASLSSCQLKSCRKSKQKKELPPLFWYMEMGDWEKATKRAKTHPREVKTRATLPKKTKHASGGTKEIKDNDVNPKNNSGIANAGNFVTGSNNGTSDSNNANANVTKRFALHHACFKLRSASSTMPTMYSNTSNVSQAQQQDVFIQVCKFIVLLINLYPDAAGMRESRHGCLPLHLAAFASGTPREPQKSEEQQIHENLKTRKGTAPGPSRPIPLSTRTTSDATNMTEVLSQEFYAGEQTSAVQQGLSPRSFHSHASAPSSQNNTFNNFSAGASTSDPSASRIETLSKNNDNKSHDLPQPMHEESSLPQQSSGNKSSTNKLLISAKREEMMVEVINALLDAYPKAIRVDSEGGRLALHTACAGRATPRVISTLVTAYPAAARHRNKDGFLPLHLAAHWGVSHPNVAITLLKAYPDATVGFNRWERTPLEEALCMAGENGRPYQAPMVRALRKHPSYWTRPPQELFETLRREREVSGPTLVDMDETIASNGSDDQTNEYRYFNSGYTQFLNEENFEEVGYDNSETNNNNVTNRFSPLNLISRNKGESSYPIDEIGMDIATLIKNLRWKSVVERLKYNPDDAGEQLKLPTRGGFIASCGMMPLHYACERKPPIEVVGALIEANPEAVGIRMMPGGCLPIHVACTWCASPFVIRALYQADLSTSKAVDELGNRPLHAACFSGAVTPVIDSLLSCYPKAVLSRNNQGSEPLDIVRRLRHDNKKVVIALLAKKKEIILGSMLAAKKKKPYQPRRNSTDRAQAMGTNEVNRGDPPVMGINSLGINNDSGFRRRAENSNSNHQNNDVAGMQGPVALGLEVTYCDSKDNEPLLWI